MNFSTIALAAVFIAYDLVALGTIYVSYSRLKTFFKQSSGRSLSAEEKMFFTGISALVGILWLPLVTLSILYSKVS